MSIPEQDRMTCKEAAAVLGINRKVLDQQRAKRSPLRWCKVGGRVWYSRAQVEEIARLRAEIGIEPGAPWVVNYKTGRDIKHRT